MSKNIEQRMSTPYYMGGGHGEDMLTIPLPSLSKCDSDDEA